TAPALARRREQVLLLRRQKSGELIVREGAQTLADGAARRAYGTSTRVFRPLSGPLVGSFVCARLAGGLLWPQPTMIFTETKLLGAFIIDLERREDDRGFFARAFCQREFASHGLKPVIAQANIGFNRRK